MLGATLLDYRTDGALEVPAISFLKYNLLLDVSRFYGVSLWHYHLTQSLPILLTTSLPYFGLPFVRAFFRLSDRKGNDLLIHETALQRLAVGCFSSIFAFSLIPHKEWRFLHPILPVLLLFAAEGLVGAYRPLASGGLQGSQLKTLHSGLRVNKRHLLYFALTPIIPYIYLGFFHGRAQVSVTEWLSEEARRSPDMQVLYAGPCHQIPWMSHIDLRDRELASAWRFLTCEPPLK